MALSKFESMLKTNSIYFFDLDEFEEIIIHYLDNGKHSLAKKAVQLGLEQHPSSIDLKLLEVEILIFDNNLEKASRLVKKIELLDPNNEEVYIQKATIYSKTNAHKQAIESLKTALIYSEDKAEIWSLMGMEYLYLDDFENARLNFAKCIDVDYEDYSSLYNVVYCFDMQKDHDQAIKYLNAYINRNPYSEVAWHQLGRQYFMLNMYKEALTSFDYAVLIDESFIGAYLEKAKTLEQMQMYEQAIENYLITLELDDPTAYAFSRVGECYYELNDDDQAIYYFKKAVHEDPLLDKGWILLTDAYMRRQNYQKALYYISKAIKIDDSNSVYWRKYAEINIKLGFYEEAVEAFGNCLDLKDESLEIYIALSDVLLFLGEFNDALRILIAAQKVYKDFAEIEYRLSGLFYSLNKDNYGFDHLVNGLKIDFEYHIILEELFGAVYDKEDVKSLIYNYKKAME